MKAGNYIDGGSDDNLEDVKTTLQAKSKHVVNIVHSACITR